MIPTTPPSLPEPHAIVRVERRFAHVAVALAALVVAALLWHLWDEGRFAYARGLRPGRSTRRNVPYLATPAEYAIGKKRTMESRWAGELGPYARAFVGQVFGVCPQELAIGATAMSLGRDEDVLPRHERGYFNTSDATWNRLRDDAPVRALLGDRDAIRAGARGWQDAIADQTAIGLVDLLGGTRAVGTSLSQLAAEPVGSAWGWFLAFCAWSAGAGRTASHLRPHAAALAAVPEADRLRLLFSRVARASEAGDYAALPMDHPNPAYSVLRSWQKLECARILAVSLGTDGDAWWRGVPDARSGEGLVTATAITRGALGERA